MLRDFEGDALRDSPDRALEVGILEGLHLPAVAADGVMVVMAVRFDSLVCRRAAGQLDPRDQAEFLELLQRPVDAGSTDARLASPQLVVELQSGDRAVVAGERFDHRGPSAAAAQPGGPQGGKGMLLPADFGRGRHAQVIVAAEREGEAALTVRSSQPAASARRYAARITSAIDAPPAVPA